MKRQKGGRGCSDIFDLRIHFCGLEKERNEKKEEKRKANHYENASTTADTAFHLGL